MRIGILAFVVLTGFAAPACAFQADGFTNPQVVQALRQAEEHFVPQIAGKAYEILQAMRPGGQLAPNPRDPLTDVFINGIAYQAKSGLKPSTIGAICTALRTERYPGQVMTVPNDTLAAIVERCGPLASDLLGAGKLEPGGITTTEIQQVYQAQNTLSAQLAGALPYVAVAVAVGLATWEIYDVASKSDRPTAAVGKSVFSMAASTGATYGAVAGVALLVPTAFVVVPIAAGAVAGAGVAYLIDKTGLGDAVGDQTERATTWVLDRSKAGWVWTKGVFQ